MNITELHLDLTALRGSALEIVDSANAVTGVARPLRLPLPAPATDPYSLQLVGRINDVRRTLGLLGEAAADELVCMAEQILAGSFTLASLALRTQTAIMGLAVTPISASTQISPAASRPAPPPPATADATLDTDDEILSAAVLLSAGTQAIPDTDHDTDALAAASQTLQTAAGQLRAAHSAGGAAAATLERFAQWISSDYAAAIEVLDANTHEWGRQYSIVRNRTDPAAQAYISALAAKLSGTHIPVDPTTARTSLEQYGLVDIAMTTTPPFPRLGRATRPG